MRHCRFAPRRSLLAAPYARKYLLDCPLLTLLLRLSLLSLVAAFEDAIIGIGRGVEDLKDLAVRQNEEVKMQNVLLSDMADRMDIVSSKMVNVNSR